MSKKPIVRIKAWQFFNDNGTYTVTGKLDHPDFGEDVLVHSTAILNFPKAPDYKAGDKVETEATVYQLVGSHQFAL
jgi:hypothetical protein